MTRPLILLIPYFGRWPAWIEFFVESCKWNPDVQWLIYTDCGKPQNTAANVAFVELSFREYLDLASWRLGIRLEWSEPYKLCDLRPCLGQVHEDEIAGYRFFGYGDIDVIYGNIRAFYTDALLAQYAVISTHPERLSGHFAVFRNTKRLRQAYAMIPNLLDLLAQPHYSDVDEGGLGKVFLHSSGALALPERHPLRRDHLFVERYSTVLSTRGWHDGTMNYPQRWFWHQGRLTNDRDGTREFLYLHFMRWQSRRWINSPPAPGEGAWVGRDIIQTDWRHAGEEGFGISADGFSGLKEVAGVPHNGVVALHTADKGPHTGACDAH